MTHQMQEATAVYFKAPSQHSPNTSDKMDRALPGI